MIYQKQYQKLKNWDFFSVNALNTFNEKYSKENISVHAKKIINIIRT